MSGPMVLTTHAGLEIKARRRLQTPGAFDKLLEELANAIAQKETQGQTPPVISDLDISQNKLSFEQFEAVFTQLGAHNVHVQRFRLFGCATLNDDVVRVIGDYFRLLTKENAPTEMHLSDCAITTDGFLTFVSAFEETDLYPLQTHGRNVALYLRLENNYISEAAIQEKVDLGVMKPYNKSRGSRPSADGTTKIDLVVRDAGKYQQKEGEPPAPEDAPPPREVWDNWDQKGNNWQGGGGGSWQPNWQGGQNWARPQNGWGAPGVRPAQNFAAAGALPARVMPGGGIRPGGAQLIAPRMISPGGLKTNAAAGGWPRGSAGTAAAQDRSRTPVARTNGGAARPPTAPPPASKKGDLPHPWEEHWSDEYQIPYFWNAETGDSLWEKPQF
mmetsp:Transcript_41869/g.110420  ORF Transcript_41869/g.110420 Transcript_41869/m.110420 type:complete len:386 (+) Transcript_41869:99-1256(+)